MFFNLKSIGVRYHNLMASISEKAIPFLAGNLKSGRSHLITAVSVKIFLCAYKVLKKKERDGRKNSEKLI